MTLFLFRDLQKMVYLNQVIYEAMRVYPPLASVTRVALRDTHLGRYHIQKGDKLLISILGIHRFFSFLPERERIRTWYDIPTQLPTNRSTKTWPHPMEFNPDNFDAKSEQQAPHSFMPWVAGPST